MGAGTVTVRDPWLEDDLLLPGDPQTDPAAHGIGVNGIAVRGDRVFVSVSDSGRIVRVPIAADGSADTPAVIAEAEYLRTADGIAFDAFGGLWVTTDSGTADASPGGGLYRLTPCAGTWTIADDPGWLNYPTTPVFGTTAATRCTLFVENDDAELIHQVSEERAALESLIGRPLEPLAEVFRIAAGEARFWTLGDILRERELEVVRF